MKLLKSIFIGIAWFLTCEILLLIILAMITWTFNPFLYNWLYGLVFIVANVFNIWFIFSIQKEEYKKEIYINK